MQFSNFSVLPKNTQKIIQSGDYIGYVRVYYDFGYGSRLFFKDAANGTIAQMQEAEKKGQECFSGVIKKELKEVLLELFEVHNPNGPKQFFAFCEKNNFDRTGDIYEGYCVLENSLYKIMASKSDDYFCRVYFFEK